MIRHPRNLLPAIDTFEATGLEKRQRVGLRELFKGLMRPVSAYRVREAWFETDDLDLAEHYDCKGFSLHMIHIEGIFTRHYKGPYRWEGEFIRGDQRVRLSGRLIDWEDEEDWKAAAEWEASLDESPEASSKPGRVAS